MVIDQAMVMGDFRGEGGINGLRGEIEYRTPGMPVIVLGAV